MCGRVDLSDPEAVMNWLINRRWKQRDRIGRVSLGEPRPNVPPSLPVPILRKVDGEDVVELMRWQIHCNVNGVVRPIANARSDKIFRFAPYRSGVAQRRCVFLACAFFEWTKDKADRRPRRIAPADNTIFKIAGFYQQEDAAGTLGCCLITTDANEAIATFHDRMPVLLDDDGVDAWLSAEDRDAVSRLLVPAPNDFISITLADTAMNKVPRQ